MQCQLDPSTWSDMPRSIQEIIDHADELAAQFEAADPDSLTDVPVDEYLLRRAARARAHSELTVERAVTDARTNGMPWRRIGELLGTSAQAAQQRYRHVKTDLRSADYEFVTGAGPDIAPDQLPMYLSDLGLPSSGQVSVSVMDGLAELEGIVPDQATREKLILAVGNTANVRHVRSRLQIDSESPSGSFHTVHAGETLAEIAKQIYGDASRYPEIFEANKPMISDPNLVFPGQVVRAPAS